MHGLQVREVLLQGLPKNDWKRHKHECSRVAAAVTRKSPNEVYYGIMDAESYLRWQEVMNDNYKWEEFDPEEFELNGVSGSTGSNSGTGSGSQ